MKKFIAILIVFVFLTAAAAEAAKGGVPELWSALSQLESRVAAIERAFDASAYNSLLQRVGQLEQKVSMLEQERSALRAVPVEAAKRVPQAISGGNMIIIEPSSLTLGDYLDGRAAGELIILTEPDFAPSLPEAPVNCGIGSGVFVNDRSQNSSGVTRNYTRSLNTTVVKQFQNWTSAASGNMSCVPAAVGAAIEYWNRTLPGFSRNMTLFNITDRLHRMMGTTPQNGTSIPGFLSGVTVWINRTGHARNMSITFRGDVIGGNKSALVNGVNTTSITGTGDPYNPIDAGMVIEEFSAKKEFVLLIIEVHGGSHAIAIHSMNSAKNSDGSRDIAVMDPATGEIIETQMYEDGSVCVEWNPDGTCANVRPVQQVWSISMLGD